MAATRNSADDEEPRKRPPAITPEGRQKQLAAMAFDLVEKRLRNGSATSQETVHFLKLESTRNRLEEKKLLLEAQLLQDRSEAMRAAKVSEEMYKEALNAFRSYSGQEIYDEE